MGTSSPVLVGGGQGERCGASGIQGHAETYEVDLPMGTDEALQAQLGTSAPSMRAAECWDENRDEQRRPQFAGWHRCWVKPCHVDESEGALAPRYLTCGDSKTSSAGTGES